MFAKAAFSPHLRLMRWHQPTGFWLVYWPCVWSIFLAASLHPAEALPATFIFGLCALFGIGGFVMRSFGCIINDMADREFDKHVERTRNRPLASGELQMKDAWRLLFITAIAGLSCLGALMMLVKPYVAITTLLAWSLPVIGLIIAYPFMKRITWWPQAFLGIAFNWGIIMAWISIHGTWRWEMAGCYLSAFCLTLGYDTIYGHQDKKDDVRIGVKSSSLRTNTHPKRWLGAFYGASFLLLAASLFSPANAAPLWLSAIALAVYGAFIAHVLIRLEPDTPASCKRMFDAHATFGAIFAIYLLAYYLFPHFLMQ